jgi:butyryl-CoA dehydrogenase
MGLLLAAARYADLAEHAGDRATRERAGLLLDTLTPVAKSFPAEAGYEVNALAVQIHGGYGYSTEYLPESWLRDQKLNSIHEGTTGIEGIDLLGRKAMAADGAALRALAEEIGATAARAREAGVEASWCDALEQEVERVGSLTAKLAGVGLADAEGMLLHSADYLTLFSSVVVAWQWLEMAAAARRALPRATGALADFYRGKIQSAQYWFRTELPRVAHLADLCASGEDSYQQMAPDWF